MQDFIDTATQQVWAFEDDVEVSNDGGVYSFTAAHGEVLNVPGTLQPYVVPPPTDEQIQAAKWGEYQAQARVSLEASDVTILRCIENGVAIPSQWAAYRKSLRSIVSAPTGDATLPLPVRPAYPAGS